MITSRHRYLAWWFAFAFAACQPRGRGESSEAPFIGTWELLSIHTRWPDGRDTEPWGSTPIGRLTYGADARMSAQLMDERRNQADGREVAADVLPNVASYYGTYSIDTGRRVVIHHVVVSLRQNESGTLERRYELRGDTLVLAADALFEGAQVTHTLHWRRAATP
jgi:hypothetical protein